MNKMLAAALVGVVGLALGFGAGWAWENVAGGAAETPTEGTSSTPASSPATS